MYSYQDQKSAAASSSMQSKIFNLQAHLNTIKTDAKLICLNLSQEKICDAKVNKIMHGHMPDCLAVLADGRLASGSNEKNIRVWDVKSGQCVQLLDGHGKYNTTVLTVLPDGRLASGSNDSSIKFWNMESGKCVATLGGSWSLSGHSGYIYSLAILADGRLASGSSDKSIKLWDIKNEKCVQTLNGNSHGVASLVALEDGRLASGGSGSNDGNILLWDVKTGKCVLTLSGHNGGIKSFAVLADGRLVSGSHDKNIKLWDVSTGQCLQTLSGHSLGVTSLAVLTDGRLASGSYDSTIKLWDLKSGKCVETLNVPVTNAGPDGSLGNGNSVSSLVMLADGRLASGWGYPDSSIKLWNVDMRALILNDIEPLLTALPTTSIKQLNLQNCLLQDSNIIGLIKLLSNTQLTHLDLRNTQITAIGIKILYQGLKEHTTLKHIQHEEIPAILAAEQALIAKQKAEEEVKKKTAEAAKIKAEHEIKLQAATHNRQALALMQQNRFQEAQTCFAAAIKLDASQAEYHQNNAETLMYLKRIPEALVSSQTAIKLDSQQAHYHNLQGILFCLLNQEEKALACYDAAIKLKPSDISYYENKINALRPLTRYSEMLPCYDAIIKAKPNEAAAYNSKGWHLLLLDRYVEAEAAIDKSLNLDAKSAAALDSKGNILYRQGKYAEALDYFDTALKIMPDLFSQSTGNSKANALLQIKRYTEALNCFEKVLMSKLSDNDLKEINLLHKFNPLYLLPAEGKAKAEKEKHEHEMQEKFNAQAKQLADMEAKIKLLSLQSSKPPLPAFSLPKPHPVSPMPVIADTKLPAPSDIITVSLNINYNEIKLGAEIGRGSYGIVYHGTWRYNTVAVKQLLAAPTGDLLQDFKKEIHTHADLRSEHIVQLYGACLGPYCMVMQYMPKGSLFHYLKTSKATTMDWAIGYKIITDIACGLAFLHGKGIVHRDLKSLNVLLDENYHARLSDFGLAKIKKETSTTSSKGGAVGTLAWMAPEIMEGPYTQKSDIYSLGITLWEVAAREIPFKDVNNPLLIPLKVIQGTRDAIPADCPPKMAHLIKWCWDTDPTKRPTAAEAVKYLRDAESDFKPSDNKPNQNDNAAQVNNLASASFVASYQPNTPVMKK